MRFAYRAQDRGDLVEPLKCLARSMATPTPGAPRDLKSVARYLRDRRHLALRFEHQIFPKCITTSVDSDHAGCKLTRRSTHRWVSVGRERLERAMRQAEQAWTTFSVAETKLVAAREARNASGREWMMCVDGGEGAERDTRDAASVSGGEAWRTTTQKQPVRSDAQRD